MWIEWTTSCNFLFERYNIFDFSWRSNNWFVYIIFMILAGATSSLSIAMPWLKKKIMKQ